MTGRLVYMASIQTPRIHKQWAHTRSFHWCMDINTQISCSCVVSNVVMSKHWTGLWSESLDYTAVLDQ